MKKDRIIMPRRLISNLYCTSTYPDKHVPAYANILGFDHGLILAITFSSRETPRELFLFCTKPRPYEVWPYRPTYSKHILSWVAGPLGRCCCQPLNECMVLYGPVGCSSRATSPELGFHNWLCLFDEQMNSELS